MKTSIFRNWAAIGLLLAGGASAQAAEFSILVYEDAATLAQRSGPGAEAYWASYAAFAGSLVQAGAMRGGAAMDETVAAPVRGDGPESLVLGGYFIVEAADLAAAKALAAGVPASAKAVVVNGHRANPAMAAPPAAD